MHTIFSRLTFWFTHRKMCAWCQPRRYIGGNPFARKETHGICPRCVVQIHHRPNKPEVRDRMLTNLLRRLKEGK